MTTTLPPHTETSPATVAGLAPSELLAGLRATYVAGVTRPASWRLEQLAQLRRLLVEGEDELVEALRLDVGKPALEAWMSDVAFIKKDIRYIEKHLDAWMRPAKEHVPLALAPGKAMIVPEPLGVALVISPWNYPVQLLLLPMACAIAAGNCVVGKPSEITPNVAAVLARLVPRYLDTSAVAIVEGGVEETTALLAERWDHIFYTGNGRVGRVVMEAAAKHLTPVTLELGGKSPAIVDEGANLAVAAKRIALGKWVNAGQTCVAPDYVLVTETVEERFLAHLRDAVRSFYGDDPSTSEDYGRVVNAAHWRRLKGLLDAGGYESVVVGGDGDEATRYLAPTVLRGVEPDAPIMQDEIFGPILPVLPVRDVDAAVDFVNRRDKPLALYVFSESGDVLDRVIGATSSGGVCANATVMHLALPELPFGGVGESGMGAYHGKAGFDTFSHHKSVFVKSTRLDLPLMYPPFGKITKWLIRRFL